MSTTLDNIQNLDWAGVLEQLDRDGIALSRRVMSEEDAQYWQSCYHDDSQFRVTINMAEKCYGLGYYRHFANNANPHVDTLRNAIYPHLLPLANAWMARNHDAHRFPNTIAELDAAAAQHGQHYPTSLLLYYPLGGYCTLHQDVYGEVYFPLQVLFCLSKREKDFTGAEFVFVEKVPGEQSRPKALTPDLGDMVIFTTRARPEIHQGKCRILNLEHGICPVQHGERYSMGIVFHNAAY